MTKICTLNAGDLTLQLSCQGGAILEFRKGDQPLLRPTPAGASVAQSACFPLLPMGNRIRDNHFRFAGRGYEVTPNTLPEPLHLHGTGWQAMWQINEQRADFICLSHSYHGPDLPHRYRAEQAFHLSPQALHLRLSVTNTGVETLPFGLGWHPFFPEGAQLLAPATRFWAEGADHLPTTAGPIPTDLDFTQARALPQAWINNAFEGWSGEAQITWPATGLGLTLSADPLFGCYQLYRPQAGQFFAFEPMSHRPDALSAPDLGGLCTLAPGASLAGGITLSPTYALPLAGDVFGEQS